MLHHIKKLLGIKKKEEPVAEVPYKVEKPAVSAVSEQASQAVVESIAPAKKKPAAAKKPRAPKTPKAV
jgi:hypothetical protein